MTAYPVFDEDDLSDFTGRPSFTFPAYTEEAISQATFLIRLRIGKINPIYKQWPEDEDLQRAFTYAILDLANQMMLEREYDRIKANPAASETIGSYSWSKSNAAQLSLYNKRPTGIQWLDLLLDLLDDLEDEDNPLITHGSTHVFENDGVYLDSAGERWVLGPSSDAYVDPMISKNRYRRGDI